MSHQWQANPLGRAPLRPGSGAARWVIAVGVAVACMALYWAIRPPAASSRAGAHPPVVAGHGTAPGAAPFGTGFLKSIVPKATAPHTDGLSQAQLIARLLDPKESLAARRAAARALARSGTAEALEALECVLREGPAALRAAAAEALGECPSPDARPMLLTLANSADESAARGAMRGLAALGDAAAAKVLAAILADDKKSAALRTEAALALGGVRDPAALGALTRALRAIRDETILNPVLDGLGHRPFAETAAIFSEFLQRDDITAASRVAAIEALGHVPDSATSFLLGYANDPNQELRAAAGWALNSADNPGEIAPQLLGWLQQENDPAVRLRLYQALSRQDAVASAAVLPAIQRESDADARVAGLGLLADTLRADGNPVASRYFDATAVAELKTTALTSARLDQSLAAIMALDRAGTPAAVTALGDIAQQPADPACRAAAQQALKRHSAK